LRKVVDLPRPTIGEQIREIDFALGDYPQYTDILNFHKAILEILMPTGDFPTKGAREALSDEAVKDLKERAVSSKKPIRSFLDASIFDEDNIMSTASDIVECLMHSRPGGETLEGLLKALEHGEVDARATIGAILGEDASCFQQLGDMFGVEPALLLFIFETPLRPFFEDIARRVEEELIETWWEPFCPVCGRTSPVARVRQRKRYMTCTYCGAEYLVDLFLCVYCGNKDPHSLGFIAFEEHPEYELDYCEKCNHYIKVIYEERRPKKIPRGLEDLLTRELDVLAKGYELGQSRT